MITGNLPEGWQWTELASVCDFLDSYRIPVNDIERQRRIQGKTFSELYPYYGANGQVGWIDDYLFDEPLILLAEDGGFFGSRTKPIAYKIEGKSWVNNHAHVLRPKPEVIDFNYCLYSLMIRPDVADLVAGATRAKLNQAIARTILIPLPPLDEQRRIAALIEAHMQEVERARDAVQTQIDAAEQLMAAYLREVFESEAAQSWEKKPLLELIEDRGQYGLSLKSSGTPIGVPMLGMGNIRQEQIVWDNLSYIDLSDELLSKYLLRQGDILFNRTNSAELVGKSAVFDGSRDAVFASYLIRFKTKSDVADPNFVVAYINSASGRHFIEANMTRAIGQVNISASTMHTMPIPMPPLNVQQRIVKALTEKRLVISQVLQGLQPQLDCVKRMPAAILQQAFAGEL